MIIQINSDNISVYIEEITALYVEVFSAPPRYEIINHDNLKEEILLNIIDKIMYAYINNSKIVGFISMEPAYRTKDYQYMSETNISLMKNPNSYMISESFVSEKHRGQGIAMQLFKRSLLLNKGSIVFSRSRLDAFAQNKIFTNLGFKAISKIKVTTNGIESIKYLWEYKIF